MTSPISLRRKAAVRTATEADLPALEWDGEYSHYRRLFKKAMKESIHGRRVLLLAEVNGELVGQIFVQLMTRSTHSAKGIASGYLYAFRVKPAYRNQGVGTQLLRRAESELGERGFSRAVISVAKNNPAALRLYERYGFQTFADDPGEWSYLDDEGRPRKVREPAYMLEKRFQYSSRR